MDYGEWAQPHLKAIGFDPLAQVITLTKTDHLLPASSAIHLPEPNASGITLRSATYADLAAIVTVDRVAFEPHWWRSLDTVRRRAATTSGFTVAEYRGDVIGYTEHELHPPYAHLNRIAIHPRFQSQGIGALLLRHVLRALWRLGAETISLNTEHHNHRSRRLYDSFGFETTRDAVTVWTLVPVTSAIPL
jgi:ribosomal protein S18 acetylase RimI-like enzyme